jgi:DNA-binding response OmpR family regulator
VTGGLPVRRDEVQSVPLDMPARVRVVMDQRLIAETIVLTLNHGVFFARVAPNLSEATGLIEHWRPHLAVIDMDLGDAGLLAQLGIRRPERGTTLPVLAMTRRGDLKTKLASFEQGVDDIMTVPFSPEELLARALAVTRRSYGESPALRPTIRLGEIEIDILNREVRAGTSVLHLTGLEQSLLYLLAANVGQVVTRDEILDALWGSDFVAESNVVDRHIRSLRAKLQNDWRKPRFIATVPGKGYRFLPAFSEDTAPAVP